MAAYWEPDGFYQLGTGDYAGVSAADVLKRMYEVTKTGCMLELANWLGVRQSCLSDAKRRNIIPIAWVRALALKGVDCNPDWVLTGQGEKVFTLEYILRHRDELMG